MQNTVKCPVCNSELEFNVNGEKKIKRISFPPTGSSRSQFYMNLIFLLVGALLALAGVSVPSCSEYGGNEYFEPIDSDSKTEKHQDTETAKIEAIGSEVDTATTDEKSPLESDSDSVGDTGGDDSETVQTVDTGSEGETDSDSNLYTSIIDDCEEMRTFFSDCYWAVDNFTGPTYQQITKECSLGTLVSADFLAWHSCWDMEPGSCTCPDNSDDESFSCNADRCLQWIYCMESCRF